MSELPRRQRSVIRRMVSPPQQLVLFTVEARIDFWRKVRSDNSLAPEQSLNILADWAHLRRFSPESLNQDQDVICRLNDLVKHDHEALVSHFMQTTFPVEWTSQADSIDNAWDDATTQDIADELTSAITDHFDLLDSYQLALYAADFWVADGHLRSRFADFSKRQTASLTKAEEYVADHVDVFLSAAPHAADMLGAYREDLYEFDSSLWATVLKHRRLEEHFEELTSS